jgi:hypothetical protein
MERHEIINMARIGTDVFLIIVIGMLLWQFFTADAMVKDIALYDQPEQLVKTYENITGFVCMCGSNMIDRFELAMKQKDKEMVVTIPNFTMPTLYS